MTANFPVPNAKYAFTSALPDTLTLCGIAAESVLVDVELSGEVVFSATLYAYNGKASVYDLRSVVERHMEQSGSVSAPCRFHYQEDRADTYSDTFLFIYSRFHIAGACQSYLQSHFLTTQPVRLVPRDFQLDLAFCLFPGEQARACTLLLLRPTGGGAPVAYTVDEAPLAAAEFQFCIADLSQPSLLSLLPEGASGTLLSATVVRGSRTFTLFFTDQAPTLQLNFRNEFNTPDTLYLTAQTKRVLSFDRQTAVCCGRSSYYDDTSALEYESATSMLSPSRANYLTFVLQLTSLSIVSDLLSQGSSILVTDIESEISDAQNAQNRVTFKWKCTTQQQSLPTNTTSRIFNENYNAVYR